jgi:hypothetical protein
VIHNTYIDKTVIVNNTTVNRTSFNGPNGITAQPTPQERTAMNEPHVAPAPAQIAHEQAAKADRTQLASVNHGSPANAAVSRPIAAAHAAPAAAAAHPQAQAAPQAKPPAQPNAQAKPANAPAKPPAKPKPAAKPAEPKSEPKGDKH